MSEGAPGEVRVGEHDEEVADREVDLVARKHEKTKKKTCKKSRGALTAQHQQYRTYTDMLILVRTDTIKFPMILNESRSPSRRCRTGSNTKLRDLHSARFLVVYEYSVT